MSAEEDRTERSTNYGHGLVSIGAATTITFYPGTGTDTASVRYLKMGVSIAYACKIVPTDVITVTAVNGVNLKVAEPVGTAGWSTKSMKITSVTVETGAADVTSVEMRG